MTAKSIGIALSLLMVAACQHEWEPAPYNTQQVDVDYTDEADKDEIWEEAGARITGPRARLTIEYMNNETEIFRPQSYTVRLWKVDDAAEPSRAFIDALGNTKYDRADITATKKANGLAFTRKTVTAGWYVAEFDGSGVFFKFNAAANSDGLLIFNEHDFTAPLLAGYYASYGKIKFTFGKQASRDAQAFLILRKNGQQQRFWLYAEDSKNQMKSQYWFLPTDTYTGEWFLGGSITHKTGIVVIAPGKTYPTLK